MGLAEKSTYYELDDGVEALSRLIKCCVVWMVG